MKRLLISIFIILPMAAMAQRRSNYSSTLQATGGYVEDGYGIMASYDYYVRSDQYVQFSVLFSLANDIEGRYRIPYALLTFQPGYYFRVWEGGPVSMPMSLSLGAGGILGYEDINKGSQELPTGALLAIKSGFVYGAFAGFELEYHLDNFWSLLLRGSEHFHVNSGLGEFQPYVALGLKYYLF